jgi:hypothetical protein
MYYLEYAFSLFYGAIMEVMEEIGTQVPEDATLQKIQKRLIERNCLPNENTEYGTMFARACCGMKATERLRANTVDNLVSLL